MRAPEAASRLRGLLPSPHALAAATFWATLWGLAWALGGFSFLEEPLGDLLWRLSQSNRPTESTWVIFADAESARRGADVTRAATWTGVLERARELGLSAIVVLDPAARAGLGEALERQPPGRVRVLVPSRRHPDPFMEGPARIEPYFPDESRFGVRPFEAGLLDFLPDPDGTWRRTALADDVGRKSLPALLQLPDLEGKTSVRHVLSGPAGVESRASLWRVLNRDLEVKSWRGGVWIVAPDSGGREIWSSAGERLPEERALAQLVEGMRSGRWYAEAPAWGIAILAFAGFAASWLCAARMPPLKGLFALTGATLALLGFLWTARIQLLWFVPLVPAVPTAAAGFCWGLAERHRRLRRGMGELLLRLGHSRVLNPILSRPAADERDVAAFRALLDLDAAAVLTSDPERPLMALATRPDRADLWDWFTPGARTLVEALKQSAERPLFFRPADAGPQVIVETLAEREGRTVWLAIAPPGDARTWWQDHRTMAGRALVPLGALGAPAGGRDKAPKAADIAVPENQLKVLRTTVDQTEIERTFLLGFLDRLSEGVLVTDLVGRALVYNKRFLKMCEELGVDLENPMVSFLTTISSQPEEAVWKSVAQTVRSEARWTLYASVQRHPVRHYMSNLVRLDLGAEGSGARGASDVLALVITEVSDLYEAERLKSELLEHFVHDVRNAVTVIAQEAEEISEVVSDASIQPDLEMIKSQALGIAERFKRMAALAGIGADKIADELTPTDLVNEAKRAINAAAAMAEQLGIIVAYEGQTVVPFAIARPNALRHALLQVIEQSLASSPRGATVTIGAQDEGQDVVLRINDPGWSPMVAISRMRTAIPTGTTLKYAPQEGLQRSVEDAGGTMSTDFDEAVGTTVKMSFPKVSNRLEEGEAKPA